MNDLPKVSSDWTLEERVEIAAAFAQRLHTLTKTTLLSSDDLQKVNDLSFRILFVLSESSNSLEVNRNNIYSDF